MYSLADPEFLIGGGVNPRGGGTYEFARFSQKLHEIKKFLGRRDPPLKVVLFAKTSSINFRIGYF